MRTTVLWLLLCIISVIHAAPLRVMSAPNLLRVGSAENIFVECQDCLGQGPVPVNISVWNHPTKVLKLEQTNVMLNEANNFQAFGELVIPPENFDKDPRVKQFVYLQAEFPETTVEKIILVSVQPGYLFIQTDKTLYTPDSEVKFRVFALTPDMKPFGRDGTDPAFIDVKIVAPEGIVTSQGPYSPTSGIYSGTYRLGKSASIGQWKVVSGLHSSPQHSYSAMFEVKKYVLPSYEVKLTSARPFYYYDAESFSVRITATYLFGKEVDGMAYVAFGVMRERFREVFTASLQRVQVIGGIGDATLQKDHIRKTFPNIEDLVGQSLFVTATVYTESGGEMVEGELRNIQIVASPYSINFDKTPKYFKAGLVFAVTVTVTNPDGTPAENVPIEVAPWPRLGATTGANGRATVFFNTRQSDLSLTVTARTNVDALPAHRQTSKSMVAKAHQSNSQNFIQISGIPPNVKLGTNLYVTINLNRQPAGLDITYLILSRGQLIEFGRIIYSVDQYTTGVGILVTKKMLPSFRLIVYYHPTPTEVVSDSVWVDVEDSCSCALKLEPRNKQMMSYEPWRTFNLRITGEPGATVALGAVDKGAYVLNKEHLLTQKKVWETVEKADFGCTPGGGKNSMAVFFDAGLVFQTDTAGGTPYRQEVTCPTLPARRRRTVTMRDPITTVGDEDLDSYKDSSEIFSRTLFSDSRWWSLYTIPKCQNNTHCELDLSFPLADSITTWVLTGISLSNNNGFCVGEPLDVVTFKKFFIDLRLPYSAVVGEQIEIRAVVHNYIDDHITVRIELRENEHVCSSAKRGKYMQQVTVGGSSTRAVPFVIIPITTGTIFLEVKALLKDLYQGDGVRKPLLVLPKGFLTKAIKVLAVNPKGGSQELTINHIIPKSQMVPNTPSSTRIFLTGREQQNFLVENVMSASSMGRMIYQPTGNGEQNMNHMTTTVVATTYLDKTNKWEEVVLEKRAEALAHIRMGFQNVMNSAKPDGSFAFFPNGKTSTWLTAHVVKVFSMAEKLIYIDSNTICKTVKFLILTTQLPDGKFKETGTIFQGEYTANALGADADASLTAFCLIAMQESQHLCQSIVNYLPDVLAKSVAYLEKRIPTLINPYAVAITSYALANANKLNKEILYRFVSPGMNHWASPLGHSYSLQATAYALLALLKSEFLEDAQPIVRWLTHQPNVGGAYGSTQATMMVYQAVSEYWIEAKKQDYQLDVDLKIPDRSTPYMFHVNQDNHYITRTTKSFAINENVTVAARGTGEATLMLVSEYYSLGEKTESNCTKFNLSVEFSRDRVDEDNGDIYILRMEFSYNHVEEDASMSILDITLPTGFTPVVQSLDALSEGRARFIAKWEYNKELSGRSSIILYMNNVSHDRTEELAFKMRQTYKVSFLQPASVSIYEYYDETRCVKFYHPQRRDGRILRLCRGDVCQCAEGNCSMQKKGNINNQERLKTACQTSIDFVYHVILEDIHLNVSFDTYTMQIKTVIKEGRVDIAAKHQLRKFLGLSHCRESLDLRRQKGYLIMGGIEDVLPDASNQFEYLLGERTWIEHWPSTEECQMIEYRPTCLGLEALVHTLETVGCALK